jgi:hypothetical protein
VRHVGTIVPTSTYVEVARLQPLDSPPWGGALSGTQPNVTFISFTIGSSP